MSTLEDARHRMGLCPSCSKYWLWYYCDDCEVAWAGCRHTDSCWFCERQTEPQFKSLLKARG